MKTRTLLLLILCCCAMTLMAGCTSQQHPVPAPEKSVVATNIPASTVPAPLTATTTNRPVPAGTPALPGDLELSQPPAPYAVNIGVDKDRVYSTITVTFLGGPGQIFVKDILVRVTRSDGLKEEAHIPFSEQIPTGASVDLPGTKGADRVMVYATVNGVTYKVWDENAVYAQY